MGVGVHKSIKFIPIIMGLLLPTAGHANSFTGSFPSASSDLFGANGAAPPVYLFYHTTGFVQQTFSGTGLPDVSSLVIDVPFTSADTQPLGFGFSVNGQTVGSVLLPAGSYTSTINENFSFAPIVGLGTYTLKIFVDQALIDGNGYVAFNTDFPGSFTLSNSASPVPLPATLPLFASGLVGLGWLGRRRRKQPQVA